MPKNNGKTRKVWRKLRADERKKYSDMYFNEILPEARHTNDGQPLARKVLDLMASNPRWINADQQPARLLPRPN